MKTPEEKITYAVICEQMPTPHLYFGTYKEAEDFAKIEQPAYRPHYIVERVEHFEICGVVGDKGKKKVLDNKLIMREPKEEKIRCNTCKNNDDGECSGECYECIKGIFDHYEPKRSESNE